MKKQFLTESLKGILDLFHSDFPQIKKDLNLGINNVIEAMENLENNKNGKLRLHRKAAFIVRASGVELTQDMDMLVNVIDLLIEMRDYVNK